MKKILSVLLAALLCVGYITVFMPVSFADSLEDQKADLDAELEQIQKEQKELDDKINSAKTELEKQKTRKNNLDYQITLTKREIKVITEKISVLEKQIKSNEKEIGSLEKEIASKGEEIDLKNSEIDAKSVDIEEKNASIEGLEESIKENFELFKDRLNALYKSRTATTLSTLLGANSLSEFLTAANTLKRVAQHDNDLLERLTSEKDEMISVKESVEQEKLLLEQDKSELEEKVDTLESDRTKLEKEQKKLEKNKAELDDENDELDKKNADLKKQVSEIENQIHDIEELEQEFKENKAELQARQKQIQAEIEKIYEKIKSEGEYIEGDFLWPLAGYLKITSSYGWRFDNTDFHTGIDIAGRNDAGELSYGKPILAAKAGTVKYVGWQANGYGNYVILDHGGGITTLYAHMSEVYVKVGQSIKRGGKVGAVGSTGWSTGAHLHFEIRKDGKAFDPMTEFPNYPNVPTK